MPAIARSSSPQADVSCPRWRRLAPGARLDLTLEATQRHWLQILRGAVAVDGQTLTAGDAIGLYEEAITTEFVSESDGAELLLIKLPG